jgi:5-methylcytosine-specific restriction endonuclease McrA
MENKSYSEKLKHPLWQKKRLEIMQRDEFMCQNCGEKEKTLNVHHIKYLKGHEIWDYDNSYLITLCNKCHSERHELIDSITHMVVSSNNLYLDEINCLLKSIEGLFPPEINILTEVAKTITNHSKF